MPPAAKEGALALEVPLGDDQDGRPPYSRPGIIAAVMLGLGRAVGEAIAVSQVIGGLPASPNLFLPAQSAAARSPRSIRGNPDTQSALAYLAVILLVLSLVFNGVARLLVRSIQGRSGRGSEA